MLQYEHWPPYLAERYYKKGYWLNLSLIDILEKQKHNDKIAIIDNKYQITYRELTLLSDNLASALQMRGIKKNDTALVQLSNFADFYITFFALLKIGVVPVNALFSHQRRELCSYATQVNLSILIADRCHQLFQNDIFINELYLKHNSLKHVILKNNIDLKNNLQSLIYTSNNTKFINIESKGNEIAFFQLSGGSSGIPKLIPRTHNDYYYSIRASADICGLTNNTRYLVTLPAAHNYPLSSPGALGVLYRAGLIVITDNPHPNICFPLISCYKINMTALVPSLVILWLTEIKKRGIKEILSLNLIQVGGSKLTEILAQRIINEMDCNLQQVFGMSEGLVNYTRLNDEQRTIISTQGRPISEDDEVWISDRNGNPLPSGKVGLLMTRGPYTIQGYYNNPDQNKKSFDQNGFYCSGDLIEILSNGYIKVRGREKDQINRAGEKIFTTEIEELLLNCPNIRDVALVPVEDELMGEKSCAFIVTNKPTQSNTIRRYLRELGVANFKLPDYIIFVDKLKLTPMGKIDKKYLSKQFFINKTFIR